MAGVRRSAFSCVGWQVTLYRYGKWRPVALRWGSPRKSCIGLIGLVYCFKTPEFLWDLAFHCSFTVLHHSLCGNEWPHNASRYH